MVKLNFSEAVWRKGSRSAHEGNYVEAAWFKSSRSPDAGKSCVEVAFAKKLVGVRDSKTLEQVHHLFSQASWTAFLETIESAD